MKSIKTVAALKVKMGFILRGIIRHLVLFQNIFCGY